MFFTDISFIPSFKIIDNNSSSLRDVTPLFISLSLGLFSVSMSFIFVLIIPTPHILLKLFFQLFLSYFHHLFVQVVHRTVLKHLKNLD